MNVLKKLDHVYQLSKSKFPDFSIQLLELCIKIKPNDLYLEKKSDLALFIT